MRLDPTTTTTAMLKAPPAAVHMGSNKSKSRARAKKGNALRRFRRLARFVMIARYWFRCGRSPKLSSKENILFFLDIPTSTSEKGVRDSSLNKPVFKTNAFRPLSEHSIVSAARRILNVPSSYRSADQVQELVQTLQTFSKFSGYPQHVQRRICKQGWYARFEPSRIVVRQQQKAEMYYFLLSGVAISRTVDDQMDLKESRRRQKAIFLRKGDTIGEKELLQNINREVTVVTKDTVEVLGLDNEEFLDIFSTVMGDKLDFLPFLKTIGELLFFPLELLQAHYCACFAQSYRRGAVISRNGYEADWVYVIQKGTCQVFRAVHGRALDQTSQRNPTTKMAVLDPEPELSSGMFPAISSAKNSKVCASLICSGVAVQRVSVQGANCPGGFSELSVPKRQNNRKKMDKTSGNPPRRSISDSHLPRLHPGGHLVTKRHLGDPDLPTTPQSDDEQTVGSRGRKKRHPKSGSFPGTGLEEIGSLSSSPSKYACLQTLSKGSIFGLQTIIYEDSPALMLVSQGAECVMVSKQFLRDHLDSTTLNKLRHTVPPHPSMGPVLGATDERATWENSKQRTPKNVSKHVH